MSKRGEQEATMKRGGMGAEDPLPSGGWSSIHDRGHGRSSRSDVARIRTVIERRDVAGELLRLLDQFGVIVDETRAQVAGSKVRVVKDGAVIADRGRRTDHDELAQPASCAGDCLRAIGPMNDELRDDRVVVRRDVRAGSESRVDANTRSAGRDPAPAPLL